MQKVIAKGTSVLNNQLEGLRFRKESRSANEKGNDSLLEEV
jgi:hypothetical protein